MQNSTQYIPHNPIAGILIPVKRELVKILWENIVLIEASDDYIKVHVSTSTIPYLVKGPMKNYEQLLPADLFCRIHRSYIVGIKHVIKITKDTVFAGNQEPPLAKPYVQELRSRFIVLVTEQYETAHFVDKGGA